MKFPQTSTVWRLSVLASFLLQTSSLRALEWTQEAHDAARTGYTAEEPVEPWTLAWIWNGPDASGGTGGHFYNAPKEAHTITGGSCVYVPAGSNGLYALSKSNGTQVWHASGTFNGTPAYDAGVIYAGAMNGFIYKFNAVTGDQLDFYNAGNPIDKAILLTGGFIYAVSEDGKLHKVNASTMDSAWGAPYTGGSAAVTAPAYSASRDAVIYCTYDAYVHAVNGSNGSQKWRRKPSPNTPGSPNSIDNRFERYWPVVADQAGVVFVRIRLNHDAGLWGVPSGLNKYPTTNAAIRSFLTSTPSLKNLFALNLDDGTEKFIPAVGYGGVEDIHNGSPYLNTGQVPVIKMIGGKEVAYQFWRNGDTAGNFDARWDAHLGEMVLDDQTVSGYQAGDLRFIQFINDKVITDEECPLTVAGDTIFHSHWGALESAKILDRSSGKGNTRANGITVQKHPTIIRRQQAGGTQNNSTHWTTGGLTLYNDGRYWNGPGWWVYWNVLDPPTPVRNAYSEGILPRYAYAADGLVIMQGHGGELFVLRHSGAVSSGSTPPQSPKNLKLR